jgi:quercetin dioxygenase-like cupin family protein
MIINREKARVSRPAPGIIRRMLAHSSQIMLTEHTLEKGAILPEHSHPHQQLVYLLEGELLLEMSGQQQIIKAGDSLVIPSDAKHKVTAITAAVALDIFSPAREDYL